MSDASVQIVVDVGHALSELSDADLQNPGAYLDAANSAFTRLGLAWPVDRYFWGINEGGFRDTWGRLSLAEKKVLVATLKAHTRQCSCTPRYYRSTECKYHWPDESEAK